MTISWLTASAALLASVAVLAATGCGSSGASSTSSTRTTGSEPLTGVTVQEAIDTPGTPVVVRGWVVPVERNLRLCTTREDTEPPTCGDPSLLLDGYAGTVSAIEQLDVAGTVTDDGTLVFDPQSLLDKGNAG